MSSVHMDEQHAFLFFTSEDANILTWTENLYRCLYQRKILTNGYMAELIDQRSLQWRHNERDGVSYHQPHDCLLNRLFKAVIKGNIKAPRHWLCEGNPPVTGGFPRQRASGAESVILCAFLHFFFYQLRYSWQWLWVLSYYDAMPN